MTRQRLPDRRHNELLSFRCNELDYTVTVSRFDDGAIGELFLTNAKADSQSDSNAKDAAITTHSHTKSIAPRFTRAGKYAGRYGD
jgi:hypothetical protein